MEMSSAHRHVSNISPTMVTSASLVLVPSAKVLFNSDPMHCFSWSLEVCVVDVAWPSILLISADNQQMTFLNVISFLFVLISWYMWVISLFGSVFCRYYRSPKFGPRPKKPKGEVVFSFGFAETKLRTERSPNPKLIYASVDFACTRYVNRLEIKFWWRKITSLFR